MMESSPFCMSQFISAPLNTNLQSEIDRCPPFHASLKHCLITGPERSGKTSILFHYAVSIAATGRKVVFVSMKDEMETSPPTLPPGITIEFPELANIMMRYLKTSKEIRKYAACFHLLDEKPAAIVIDNMSAFVEEGLPQFALRKERDKEMAMALAWLHEAVDCSGGNDVTGNTCRLVVSDISGVDGPRNQYLYQRWLPLIFSVTGGPNHFCFSVVNAPGSHVQSYPSVKFGFANGRLLPAGLQGNPHQNDRVFMT